MAAAVVIEEDEVVAEAVLVTAVAEEALAEAQEVSTLRCASSLVTRVSLRILVVWTKCDFRCVAQF